LNLGCNQLVTINRLVEATAGVKLRWRYKLEAEHKSQIVRIIFTGMKERDG
jgi:hypothetical protein